jgi:hypothetical protein
MLIFALVKCCRLVPRSLLQCKIEGPPHVNHLRIIAGFEQDMLTIYMYGVLGSPSFGVSSAEF